MRKTLSALTLTALTFVWSPTAVLASDAKVARGTITAMAGQSLTVDAGDHQMTFNVDSSTLVEARGGATKTARAAASGKAGVHLDEVLKTGQAVAVTYDVIAGGYHATEIKAVPHVTSAPDANPSMRSSGVVQSFGSDWISIKGNSGSGATFEQKLTIDNHTKVFAKGASTAFAKQGGKAPFADVLAAGDHVTVNYSKLGDALMASEIHVTVKAGAK